DGQGDRPLPAGGAAAGGAGQADRQGARRRGARAPAAQIAKPAQQTRAAADATVMSGSARHHRHSFKEYLAVEEVSTAKHEYLEGEIYAMAGGSVLHAALSAATLAALHAQLGGRCRVYSSDLRIRVRATGLASYPDVTVVCGAAETDPESADTVINPTLV